MLRWLGLVLCVWVLLWLVSLCFRVSCLRVLLFALVMFAICCCVVLFLALNLF